MKYPSANKLILLLCLIATSPIAAAQKMLIAGVKNNVLYIGVDNPLTLAAGNYKSSQIEVKVDKGTIKHEFGDSYAFTSTEPGDVMISFIRKADLQFLGGETFRVKYLPNPTVALASSNNGTITTAALSSVKYLSATLKDFDWNVQFEIDNFTATVVNLGNCSNNDFIIKGSAFTENFSMALSALKKNDIIIFSNLHATGPDGRSVLLDPVVYTIVE
jgi:hypothetical protein